MRRTLSLLIALLALPAYADGEFPNLITASDRQKLERYEETRARAMEEAKHSTLRTDRKETLRLMNKKPRSWQGFDLTGDWKCRTIKLGSTMPLIRYGWFKCRITDDGSGYVLTKLTGSQRTTGRFYTASDTQMHYLGSFYIWDAAPKPYGEGNDMNQVGIATRTGASSWRLELPEPPFESTMDVMEFTR